MSKVSFLHVYHHFSIVWAWWAALKYFPGGDSYFGALFNSSIHVLMYGYYTLALLKIPCPWKRYLTQAQLLQFFSVIIYSICSVYLWPRDQQERDHYIGLYVQLWEMSSLFILFALFYKKSYGKKSV
jgi:elongation of very long chain fatty acids protein 4